MYEKLHFVSGNRCKEITSVACGFSPTEFHYFAYPRRFINIKKFMLKIHINFIYNRLFFCKHTCYCVSMDSVTSVSRYVTLASRYPRRSSIYIQDLIQQNPVELAEAVPIV